MSLFTIADLHLSIATDHPMDVFGSRWKDYLKKIEKNWRAVVKEEDTVVLPGDISWAMNFEEVKTDFLFLESLPGKKLLGKGNHDFWWSTATKLYSFFAENGFDTIQILYNNAHIVEDKIVCGTRGWFPDESKQNTTNDADYAKIFNRELIRLRLSLDSAVALQKKHLNESGEKLPILVFLHFPPVWCDVVMQEFVDVLSEYGIEECYFGHIHSAYSLPGRFTYQNIKFTLTSSDFLSFYPLKI